MRFLGWLFIILCSQYLLTVSYEMLPPSKGKAFGLSRNHVEEPIERVNGTTGLHGEEDGARTVLKEARAYIKKSSKGKGTYGGANIARRPRPGKNAAPLAKRSPILRSVPWLALLWSSI
ncbi:hypothetical protein NMG60_11004787 [Bertholletia excelsa]